ncbi:hypothetical protein GLYMA_01G161750v4 [Glycine max]|nr:hypothetical protein GLYMA_01G161750v4 [Glycine max]KAH1163398.1 hypothetical protein GYH30_001765 [Glycine max]
MDVFLMLFLVGALNHFCDTLGFIVGQLSLNSMAREFDMHFWKPYWQCKSTE